MALTAGEPYDVLQSKHIVYHDQYSWLHSVQLTVILHGTTADAKGGHALRNPSGMPEFKAGRWVVPCAAPVLQSHIAGVDVVQQHPSSVWPDNGWVLLVLSEVLCMYVCMCVCVSVV